MGSDIQLLGRPEGDGLIGQPDGFEYRHQFRYGQVVGAFRDGRASCQRILDARVHRCVRFPVAFLVGMGDDPASASYEGRHGIAHGACGSRPQGTFGPIQELHARVVDALLCQPVHYRVARP